MNGGEQARGQSAGAGAEGPWKDFEHVLRAMDRLAERSATRPGPAGRGARGPRAEAESRV
ncbi:hypothetical protein [Streptomyces sp. NPDC008265]|uniref:hypothetical protein n=1 Tax=Streptomyces sp. NPDC008265 TaxID=3364824 RepID=UPI0036E6DE37